MQPSIDRALLIDGISVLPLDIIEWEGEEWMLIESFGYVTRGYSYFLANLNSRERFLIAGLNQVESPLNFSNLVLGMEKVVFSCFSDGKVV